ncbi:MAG: PadR family transcriptional regulator [Leptolyngbyaceae cyanobacterium MO_188.B28]|nr:PadR family transcriptional regulator [Leptolyngbyaceae cyanobacterium MO_188.B28]
MSLAHAILSALMDCPRSGYDLAKYFDSSVSFFWDATHQQIYRELSKLEAEGYLTAEKIDQEGRPNKKLFHITETGTAFLQDWIAQPSELSPVKDDLLVKLFAGKSVPKEIILKELAHHRQQHCKRLEEYRAIAQDLFQSTGALPIENQFQYLTLHHGIRSETGWLAWCDEAILFLQGEGGLKRQQTESRSQNPESQSME